jgi:hypothetical protein
MLLLLKPWLTIIVLSCCAVGWADAFVGQAGPAQPCRLACGHNASKESPCERRQTPAGPCAACCVCCANCCVTDLAAPDGLWILVACDRRAADPGWRALGRDYAFTVVPLL